MTLSDFIQLPFLRTPSEREKAVDYYQYVLEKLTVFEKSLVEVENFEIAGLSKWHEIDNIKLIYATANQLKNTVIKVLQLYYDGKPSDAYLAFKDGMDKGVGQVNTPKTNFNFTRIRNGDNLFRLRIGEVGHNFDPCELFHIPMNQREIVASQRFSIPGYPCLYFSNSTYLCWLELGKPDIFKCHASLFQPINDPKSLEEITLLDLSNNHPKLLKTAQKDSPNWDGSIFRYLSLWPLILSTSVKVKFKNRYFKPEYIIPQLLLQYIKDQKSNGGVKIHGIKYSSTHYNLYNTNNDFYNIAIPIYSSTNESYCNFLTKKFKFTIPYSWEHLNLLNTEFQNILLYILEDKSKYKEISEKKFELIPSDPQDYNISKFGMMERYLNECKMIRIDTNGEVLEI